MDIVVGLMTLAIGCYLAVGMYDGFRTGEMPVFSRTGFSEHRLFRRLEPRLFWASATYNAFLATCMFACVAIVVVRRIA